MPRVLITGANRGIGLEFARQYAGEGWEVIATTRRPSAELEGLGVRVEALDVADFEAVVAFADGLDGALDLFIANAGVGGPERIDSAAAAEKWQRVHAVNAVAPVLLAERLAAKMAEGGKMAAITSRMGSIADSSGGFISYRASKAALNAAWYALSRRMPVPMILFHPGWVQTDMGGKSAPLEPGASVAGMRRLIAGLTMEASGSFVDYQGQPVPW